MIPSKYLLYLTTIFCYSSAYCPIKRINVESSYTITTDDFLSTEHQNIDVCNLIINESENQYLLLSITNFLMFSHRKPKNPKEIVIRTHESQLIVNNKPKGYRLLSTPIVIEIPMNLNFRSILQFSKPIECSSGKTLRCPSSDICSNCTELCFPKELFCDGFDTCGEDESYCPRIENSNPLSSYKYGREVLSSSQIMLIGFFILNGAFIIFFLLLSICSADLLFHRCPIYKKRNRRSRTNFLRYLREAIPNNTENVEEGKIPETSEIKTINKIERKENIDEPSKNRSLYPRASILSRISFQPEATLKEVEPEIEDREKSPTESICSPPIHRPEVFFRRQSVCLGAEHSRIMIKNKRSFGRAMSFQQ